MADDASPFFSAAAQGSSQSQPVSTPKSAVPQGRRLLDTDDKTINLSFGGPSIYCRGIQPYVTLNGPDGEVEFVGLAEMRDALAALTKAVALAERVAS